MLVGAVGVCGPFDGELPGRVHVVEEGGELILMRGIYDGECVYFALRLVNLFVVMCLFHVLAFNH